MLVKGLNSMMKILNNKGMTIVEIVVTFVVLMILILGMLNMTNEIKTTSKEKQFYKELLEYSSLVQSTIQDDLILLKLKEVEKDYSCIEKADFCLTLTFNDSSSKKLIVNNSAGTISYDGINYIVPMKNYINDNFNSNYLKNPVSWSFENNIFVLDFPIYEDLYGNEQTNHGFKIVHLTEAAYE